MSIADMMIKTEDTNTWAMMSPEDVLLAVQAFSARHVVITGGEPALYDLGPLTTLPVGSGFSVQLETSGAIQANPSTSVTVSPKCGMPRRRSVLGEALRRGNEIKQPVGEPGDIQSLLSLPIDHALKQEIWLQPLSQSRKATELCIRQATARNWRVSIQMQKFMRVR